MSPQQGSSLSMMSDSGCKLEESEVCSTNGVGKKFQKEPAATPLPHLLAVPGATCLKQKDTICEHAVSANAENGFCTRNGSMRELLGTAAMGNEQRGNLRRFLVMVMPSLMFLVLALGVALAVQSAPQVPVTPANLQCCPFGWLGFNGVCYYFSRDYSTWEQGQERCSELNASLAIAQDEEAMDLLFRLCGNFGFWLGLRRRGERLHWGDGSSYSSRVPVLGNSQCVYLADRRFRSDNCSNRRPYVCSKAQAPL